VNSLGKPAHVACVHLRREGGCAVYEARPADCRGFVCMWKEEASLPHSLRPDLSRVILTRDEAGRRLRVTCSPANPLAWRRPATFKRLMRLCRANWADGIGVFVIAGLRQWLLTPRGVMALGEVRDDVPVRFALHADGSAQVELLAPVPAGEDAERYVATLRATPGSPGAGQT
jgi:hypothetical protein